MISRYSQILQQVHVVNELLRSPGHVQKIFSTAWYLAFQIRIPGRSFYLFVGRGGGHEGLWIGDTAPASQLRLRDTWLEWCRANLTSALLQEIKMDPSDRGVQLKFRKGGAPQDLYLLWAGRSSYFAFNHPETDEWFTSWGGNPAPGFSIFDEVGRKHELLPQEEAPPLPPILELLEKEKQQLEKLTMPKAKLKSLKVKISKIGTDLEKIRLWKPFQEWLSVTDANEYAEQMKIDFQSLRYKFPQGLTPWQRREWLFNQAKRLKLAEVHQEKRLQETIAELEKAEQGGFHEESTLKPIRPVWKLKATAAAAIAPATSEDFEIHSFPACKIAIGKTAHGNDQLRKSWAKPDDWWVHAAHGTSAHAVIKLANPGQATPEQIKQAAIFIAKRSGTTASQIEVIVTLVKNVRGVPGAAGMVTYKKQKTLLCDLSEGKLE